MLNCCRDISVNVILLVLIRSPMIGSGVIPPISVGIKGTFYFCQLSEDDALRVRRLRPTLFRTALCAGVPRSIATRSDG